jgi:hypothetical protein
VIGFAIFFLHAMGQQNFKWNPSASEFVVVVLSWLGTVSLPLSFWQLSRGGARRLGTGFIAMLFFVGLGMALWETRRLKQVVRQKQAEQQASIETVKIAKEKARLEAPLGVPPSGSSQAQADYAQAVVALGALEGFGEALEQALTFSNRATALNASKPFLEQLHLLNTHLHGSGLEMPTNVVALFNQAHQAIQAGDMNEARTLHEAAMAAADAFERTVPGGSYPDRLLALAQEKNQPTPEAARLAAQQARLKELLTHYTEYHPEVIRCRQQIESLEAEQAAQALNRK